MNITANATHYFPEAFRPGRLVLIDISGSFGGGTITPGYKAADGAFSPFIKEDGGSMEITSRGGFEVRVPRSGFICMTLAGSTAASVEFDVIPAVDMPAGS